MTEEMTAVAVEIKEEHCALTLNQINGELRVRLPDATHVSVSTLASALKGQLIVMKKLEAAPAERNCQRVKTLRREFATWLMQQGGRTELIFIDEAGRHLQCSCANHVLYGICILCVQCSCRH